MSGKRDLNLTNIEGNLSLFKEYTYVSIYVSISKYINNVIFCKVLLCVRIQVTDQGMIS